LKITFSVLFHEFVRIFLWVFYDASKNFFFWMFFFLHSLPNSFYCKASPQLSISLAERWREDGEISHFPHPHLCCILKQFFPHSIILSRNEISTQEENKIDSVGVWVDNIFFQSPNKINFVPISYSFYLSMSFAEFAMLLFSVQWKSAGKSRCRAKSSTTIGAMKVI